MSVALGVLLGAPPVFGLTRPAQFTAGARAFARNLPVGVVLMLLGTAWFLYYFSLEAIADFASMKPYMMAGFGAVGVGACFYLQDYLAVRGLAVVLLLLGKLMADTARWAETDWRLVIVSLAYVFVVSGMWLTVYPWHLRDLLNWATASPGRTRVVNAAGLALALLILVLGLTAFRPA